MESKLTPAEHLAALQAIWLAYYGSTLVYVKALDGETSRAVGTLADKMIEDKKADWHTQGTAFALRADPDIWHELANSRKR